MVLPKRILSITLPLLVVALLSIGSGISAADYYLKIDGVKGEQARVVRCANGTCSLGAFDPGSFSATVCDAQGNPLSSGSFRLNMTFLASALRESPTKASMVRESPSKASLGKTSAIDSNAGAESITTPRDSASGMATGKRQHQPMVIIKEWSASTAKPIKIETPAGGTQDEVSRWTLEVRVDRIEMK
jgi:hypothetical protein